MIEYEKIHALADGELEGGERTELNELAAKDQKVAAELHSIRTLKDTLQQHVQPLAAEDAWKACVKRLDAIDKTRKTEIFVGKYSWALCALFVVAIFSGGMLNRMNPRHLATDDVARAGASLSSVNVESVKSWLKGLAGRQTAPVASRSQFTVVSAQQGFVDGHQLVRLNVRYGDDPRLLALWVLPGAKNLEGLEQMTDSRFRAGNVANLDCVAWGHDNTVYILAAKDRETTDLQELAVQIDPSMK